MRECDGEMEQTKKVVDWKRWAAGVTDELTKIGSWTDVAPESGGLTGYPVIGNSSNAVGEAVRRRE